ncbi:ABC transporter substrate-binding protein [Solibacillus sp. FSL H8-0538]|uniref:ABC transporter substrate-binding protein n=1 Tax=Solibacillus sp. FSL H8-0538 TaxID=2921400 RepID=UPI0030F6A2F8
MKKFWQLGLSAILAVLMLVGCSGDTAEDSLQVEETSEIEDVAQAFPVTVTDAQGTDITIEQAPKKIISLIPSNTEILFSLGLDEQIIGVNDYDNFPEAVTEKERVGGIEFNLEQIIALQPDIVFAHESGLYVMGEGIAQLEAAGVKVFVVKDAVDFDETYETIEQIGLLTGKSQEATKIIADIKTKLTNIEEKVAGLEAKSVFVVVGTDPDIYAAGTGTFIDEMLQIIGVKNAVETDGWPMYSSEQFVASNPNTIIVTYENDIESINTNEAYAIMDAVKNGKVILVDGDTTSRQGPRLAEGVESIAKAVYPEAFGE